MWQSLRRIPEEHKVTKGQMVSGFQYTAGMSRALLRRGGFYRERVKRAGKGVRKTQRPLAQGGVVVYEPGRNCAAYHLSGMAQLLTTRALGRKSQAA